MRPDTPTPSRRIAPKSTGSGASERATPMIVSSDVVPTGNVYERVIEVKSERLTLTVTVRAARPSESSLRCAASAARRTAAAT